MEISFLVSFYAGVFKRSTCKSSKAILGPVLTQKSVENLGYLVESNWKHSS